MDLSERATKPKVSPIEEEAKPEAIRKWFEERERLYKQQDKDRVPYLKNAIAASPLSIHQYDALCKIYGRTKDYKEIVPLFDQGLKEVNQRIAKLPGSPTKASDKKKLAALSRLKTDFESRIKQVGVRKQRADEFRQMMAEKYKGKDKQNDVNKK